MKRNQSGFTLIEIAIVLVIIGLLLGGVLKGQELINSAKVKNLAADFKNTALYIYSYQDKFKALPGDDALVASHLTNASPATTPTAAGVGNGRIDGYWDSTTNTDESFLFWQHVRLSGITAGITSILPADLVGYIPRNTNGGIVGVTNSDATATGGLPISNLKGAYIICSSGIIGKFAKQLDVMLDDGETKTGAVQVIADTGTHPSTAANNGANAPPAVLSSTIVDSDLYTVCMGV